MVNAVVNVLEAGCGGSQTADVLAFFSTFTRSGVRGQSERESELEELFSLCEQSEVCMI